MDFESVPGLLAGLAEACAAIEADYALRMVVDHDQAGRVFDRWLSEVSKRQQIDGLYFQEGQNWNATVLDGFRDLLGRLAEYMADGNLVAEVEDLKPGGAIVSIRKKFGMDHPSQFLAVDFCTVAYIWARKSLLNEAAETAMSDAVLTRLQALIPRARKRPAVLRDLAKIIDRGFD